MPSLQSVHVVQGSRRPFIAGPADLRLLAAVGRYFYLTARQVIRLLYAPTSAKYAQARLKRLVDHGYLQRIVLPRPSRTGSAPFVYTVARKGLRTLAEWGQPVQRRYRPVEVRETSYLYLAHTLALNDVLLALDLFARRESRLTIAALRHERELKLRPVRVPLGNGAATSVIPDAWLDLRLADPIRGQTYQECYALELDRGTTEQKAWRRKVAALVAYADGPYQAAFGTRSLTIVVIATPGAERRAELLRWTEAELRALGREEAGNWFRFTGTGVDWRAPGAFFQRSVWWAPFVGAPEPLLLLPGSAAEIRLAGEGEPGR